MELSQTVGRDLNRLPYVVRAADASMVRVHFESLTLDDVPELTGARWSGSLFCSVWLGFIGEYRTLKLVRSAPAQDNIEGILRVGTVVPYSRSLRASLLETTPANRVPQPLFRGVGRVLVARLSAEGYNSGGDGSVLVRADREASGFYSAIGFNPLPNVNDLYLLSAESASSAFAAVTG